MLPQYATEQLIDNIKRRCSVPTSQLTFTDEDFVALANDELQGSVVPLIMSTREEYFVEDIDVTAPADGIVDIPAAAIGAKLRSVVYKAQENPLVIVNLPRIDLDVVAGSGFFTLTPQNGFYVQKNQIRLYPNQPISSNTPLKLYYYRRTLVLAEPASYGQVEAVDTNTNTVQLSNVPSDWETGSILNSVSDEPNFETTNAALTVVSVSSPSLELDSVEGVSVGDYITAQGYSAIPQVPLEAHAYLAQLTAVKCLEGLGDREGMLAAQEKANQLKDSLLIMISQRVDGSVKKVIQPSGGLRLASAVRRRGWSW